MSDKPIILPRTCRSYPNCSTFCSVCSKCMFYQYTHCSQNVCPHEKKPFHEFVFQGWHVPNMFIVGLNQFLAMSVNLNMFLNSSDVWTIPYFFESCPLTYGDARVKMIKMLLCQHDTIINLVDTVFDSCRGCLFQLQNCLILPVRKFSPSIFFCLIWYCNCIYCIILIYDR